MIDSNKKKKLKEMAKTQAEKLKGYEKIFNDAITKIKGIVIEHSKKSVKK